MPNPNKSEIVVVLDRSGSMANMVQPMTKGFAQFVELQRQQPGEATLTLVQFDAPALFGERGVDLENVVEQVYVDKPLAEVPSLQLEPRGGTPLNDALCLTIDSVGTRLAARPEADRPGRVIFVVITDGQENSSRKYTPADVKQRIEHQQEKYNWLFVFLGANVNVFEEARDLGVPMAGAMSYTPQSATLAYGVMARSVSAFRMSGDATVATSLLTDEERDKLNPNWRDQLSSISPTTSTASVPNDSTPPSNSDTIPKDSSPVGNTGGV